MQKISREAVEELLASNQSTPAVTMYVPTHTNASPPHISENQIRLKNLARQATDAIRAYDADSKLGKELQTGLEGYFQDMHFWQSQTPGLLVCARPGMVRLFHLPIDTDEYCAVDDSFHLAPVLALVNENHQYHVLTVVQQQPKLFIGDMYGLQESKARLPETVQSALNLDENNQKSENQGAASGAGSSGASFNGRGGGRNPQEEDRMKYFRIIDRAISQHDKQGLPLILAGIDAECVEYRSISKHPRILKQTINGSHGDARPGELFAQARDIAINELVVPTHKAAIEEYERLEGANPDRTAREMKAIQSATDQGRVDKLLASMGRHTTDTIRDTLSAFTKITFPDAEHARKLNHLATKVWQMSGTVINLTPHEMPHGAPMVARLRY